MDYVVGSVAALISGNVTPNRPKRLKKPLTPMKHQASPNVTPKSQLVDDKSIFLSPTLQKKKAIIKKSPKRIFQNDLDVTNDESESSFSSPKANKVKKHLQNELETDSLLNKNLEKLKKKSKTDDLSAIPLEFTESKKKKKVSESNTLVNNDKENVENVEDSQQSKPKKKRKRSKSVAEKGETEADVTESNETIEDNTICDKEEMHNETGELVDVGKNKTSKKKKKQSKSIIENEETESENLIETEINGVTEHDSGKKKKRKNNAGEPEVVSKVQSPKKKNKKKKSSKTEDKQTDKSSQLENTAMEINPNAVTNKDSDSEHESDDEMHSENEEENKKTLDTGDAEESSDDEEAPAKKESTKTKQDQSPSDDEIKRTLFVGNVPFSSKCKKEIKKIFNQYGRIETVRIRAVPVRDGRATPKLAVIRHELHPDRTTVNVYIKFADEASVDKALVENNSVLNGCHLRVSRSDCAGAGNDARRAVFVGNMPFALEDEALREKFRQCGEIESVRIIRDKRTNAGKGFGYVNFKSKDGVELALALTEEDLTIKNRIMRVKRCTQFTQKKFNKQDAGKQGNAEKQGYQGRQDVQKSWNKGINNNLSSKGKSGQQDGAGAYRRIKRKNQDNSEGPPDKRRDLFQLKKTRKEFVGMTAEKKKKQKFNKGQKKKKVLSEILTKK